MSLASKGLSFFFPSFFVVSIAFSLSLCRQAQAYPSFISHGYKSCAVCHFNAFGNGPLTDYGRGVAAVVIAAKPFWNPGASDEELGEQSGFLGPVPLPDWLRPDVNYRGMELTQNITQGAQNRYLTMQADVGLVLKSPDNVWLFSGSLGGTDPQGKAIPSQIISREHYIRYQPKRSLGIYLGFMDRIFGLRVPDHISYSRTQTLTAENDQTHGIALDYSTEKSETGFHLFAGNLYQSSDLRVRGASAMTEFDVADRMRVGGSVAYMGNDYRSLAPFAVHLRYSPREGESLLTEIGMVPQKIVGTAATLGNYVFLQAGQRLIRGLDLLFTTDYFTATTFSPTSPRQLMLGPALQYYPAQRIELRLDVMGTKYFMNQPAIPFELDLLSQVHLWF